MNWHPWVVVQARGPRALVLHIYLDIQPVTRHSVPNMPASCPPDDRPFVAWFGQLSLNDVQCRSKPKENPSRLLLKKISNPEENTHLNSDISKPTSCSPATPLSSSRTLPHPCAPGMGCGSSHLADVRRGQWRL